MRGVREYSMIYRVACFLEVVWFCPPSPRHTGRLRKRDNLLTGERAGRGRGRSQIIRLRKSLVLFKSFNTPCVEWTQSSQILKHCCCTQTYTTQPTSRKSNIWRLCFFIFFAPLWPLFILLCFAAFYRPQHLGIAAEERHSIVGTDIVLGKKSVQKHQHKTTTSQPTGTKLYTSTLHPMLFFAQYRCLRGVHCVNLPYIY